MSRSDLRVESLTLQLAGWLDAILLVAAHYRLDTSRERLRIDMAWGSQRDVDNNVQHIAQRAGLRLRWVTPQIHRLSSWRLPVAVELDDGQVAVITALSDAGVELVFSGDEGLKARLSADELAARTKKMALLKPLSVASDRRVDAFFKPVGKHWLRKIVFADVRPFGFVMLASLVANLMSLATILFSMQVYDRVIPAQSSPTLYVLFSGVLVALLLSWLMRNMRLHIVDVVGKRADLRISDRVFGHALRIKNSLRPRATGTFVAQLKELEPVRDMLTSTTVAAIADLPFFLLFCVVFWMLAGGLVWVPLTAFVLLLLPGLLCQKKLYVLAQECMRESSLRSSMMVEAVQGIEDIKLTQSETRFQNQWNHYNAVDADCNLRLRHLLHKLNDWTQTVQGGTFAVVVFFGAPLVMMGEMSTGVLVACSILSSRMLAPLASLSQVLNRWQQAKVAMEALDQIMATPLDYPADETRVHRTLLEGNYTVRSAVFSYDGQVPALQLGKLDINVGEKVALLGRNGSGKSTLLQALSGLMEPVKGSMTLDGVSMGHLDPADVRRDVALLTQHSRLFFGTLRDNLLLAMPSASDDELISALKGAGVWTFVQKLPMGLDYQVAEAGVGLSGGQRQGLLLARLLLRQPSVLLLDEPTASLDDVAEQQVIDHLRRVVPGRTLVVATHRPAVLSLVDRIIVLKNGQVALDGPKAAVLSHLKKLEKQAEKLTIQPLGSVIRSAQEQANKKRDSHES